MPGFLSTELLVPLGVAISMIMTRLAFLFLAIPAFSGGLLPKQITVAAVFVISISVYAGLPEIAPISLHPADLIIAVLGEAALGATVGLVSRIVLATVETAGQVLGVPMGLGFSQTVDPLSNSETMVTSRLLGLIATMLFFALDVHLVLIRYVTESFKVLGPGQVIFDGQVGIFLAYRAGAMFTSAIQLAAPVLVVLMGVLVSLGILARIAPKVNLFVLSFAVSIGVGLLALKAAIPNIVAFTRGLILSIEPFVGDALHHF